MPLPLPMPAYSNVPYVADPARFANVPPPSGLNDGRKGKGREYGDEVRSLPDGLVVLNVPSEMNTLDILNRHFRQFGEVLKMTVHAQENKAFVQFGDRHAAEAAAAVPVLGRPEIGLAWARRPKGRTYNNKSGKGTPEKIENRVLVGNPEEQRRFDDAKRQRDELSTRKAVLLGNLTDQLKTIMAKLNDTTLTEAKRDTYRALLFQIKEKMDLVGGEPNRAPEEYTAPPKPVPHPHPPPTPKEPSRYTLDLRTKVLQVTMPGWTLERLREELRKLGADDQACEVQWLTQASETALVKFKERWPAEQVFNQRNDLAGATVEWCERPPAACDTQKAAEVGKGSTWEVDLSEEDVGAG